MAGAARPRLGSAGRARGVGAGRGPVRNHKGGPQFVDCVRMVHLDRDFRKCVDRGGEAEAIGRAGQKASAKLFAAWWDLHQRTIDREALQAVLDPVAGGFRAALERGCGCADAKAATFCENLMALYPALWQFAAREGIEPTNNHAERIVRNGVLWRKDAFGSHNDGGCRFAERMLADGGADTPAATSVVPGVFGAGDRRASPRIATANPPRSCSDNQGTGRLPVVWHLPIHYLGPRSFSPDGRCPICVCEGGSEDACVVSSLRRTIPLRSRRRRDGLLAPRGRPPG